MTSPAYQLDLPVFSGPLDLLLHLIERQELDITAISLAQVTAQYLAQVEQMRSTRMEHLIDFIVIGARLALIKSRALLPRTPSPYADEELEEDPADALLRQLQAYRQFKRAAVWLKEREEAGLRTHLRVAPPPRLDKRLDLSDVTVDALLWAVRGVLARVETLEESVSLAQPRQLTIEGQIKKLRSRLAAKRPFLFAEVLSKNASRVELAVTLLAILELIKRREVTAVQAALFGPIEIHAASQLPPTLLAGKAGQGDEDDDGQTQGNQQA